MAKDEKIINKALAEKPTKKTVSKGKNNYKPDKATVSNSKVKKANINVKIPGKGKTGLAGQIGTAVNMRTKAGRKAEYKRLRKNYSSYKSRMKKKGIYLPEMPAVVKDPKKEDITEMRRFTYMVKEVYKDKEAREYKAVYEKIRGEIAQGKASVSGADWDLRSEDDKRNLNWRYEKADATEWLLADGLYRAEEYEDYTLIQEWKNNLRTIESTVHKFIFSSMQGFEDKGRQSGSCWQSLVKAVKGSSFTPDKAYTRYSIWRSGVFDWDWNDSMREE